MSTQLWIVSYQCRTNSLGPCAENKRIKIEELQCDRLHGDKTGPWAMLSDGMTGSKCGELTVSDFVLSVFLVLLFVLLFYAIRENLN